MGECKIAVSLNGTAKPQHRFFILRKVQLGCSGTAHPVMSRDIARADSQCFPVMVLSLLRPPQRGFCHADERMGIDQVAIQNQRMLEFGDRFVAAIDSTVERAKYKMRKGMIGRQRKGLGCACLYSRQPRGAIVSHEAGAKIHIHPSLGRQRVDVVRIELQRSLQQSLGRLQIFYGRSPIHEGLCAKIEIHRIRIGRMLGTPRLSFDELCTQLTC